MATDQETKEEKRDKEKLGELIEEFAGKIRTSRQLAEDAEEFLDALDEIKGELEEIKDENEIRMECATTLQYILDANQDATLRKTIETLVEVYQKRTGLKVAVATPLHIATVCSNSAA